MPIQQRRPITLTKYIADYVKEVPLVWEAYVTEKTKGTEPGKAEGIALRSIYSSSSNVGAKLKTWKKHRFWPEDATEEIRETWTTYRTFLSAGMGPDRAESEAVGTVLKDYPHASEALEIWKKCGVWSDEPARATEDYWDEPSMSEVRPGISGDTSGMFHRSKPEDMPGTSSDIPRPSRSDSGLTRDDIVAQLRALLSEIEIEERKWYGKATGKAPEEDKFLQIGARLPRELVLEIKRLPGRHAHHLEKALKLYLMVLRSAQR